MKGGAEKCDILIPRTCAFPAVLSLKKVNSEFKTILFFFMLRLGMPNIVN